MTFFVVLTLEYMHALRIHSVCISVYSDDTSDQYIDVDVTIMNV